LVPGIRRLHVTYARGGYPDARAMVKALHDLIDLDPVLVASTCSRFFADASSTAPADLHAVLDWEFSTLAKDLADPAQEGFLYRLDRLAHGDMWTFFTTAGVGEDLCGDLLGKLADVLRFRYVSTAFFNTGIDCATL
jgi:hypothetical protein